MKKALLSIFGYFLFFVLAASAIYSASPRVETTAAPDKGDQMLEESEEQEEMVEEKMIDEEVEGMAAEEIGYTLPYPGILPDHPLYFLKQIRDNILDFFIRDPLKRVEFNLLMADKRVNMGSFLVDKEKYQLAQEIVLEAEEYYTKAVEEFAKAEEQGREIRNELVEKLNIAAAKHRQVIANLEKSSPEEVKQGYQKVLEIISQAEANLQNIGK